MSTNKSTKYQLKQQPFIYIYSTARFSYPDCFLDYSCLLWPNREEYSSFLCRGGLPPPKHFRLPAYPSPELTPTFCQNSLKTTASSHSQTTLQPSAPLNPTTQFPTDCSELLQQFKKLMLWCFIITRSLFQVGPHSLHSTEKNLPLKHPFPWERLTVHTGSCNSLLRASSQWSNIWETLGFLLIKWQQVSGRVDCFMQSTMTTPTMGHLIDDALL